MTEPTQPNTTQTGQPPAQQPPTGQQQGTNPQGQPGEQPVPPANFDDWFKGQADEIKDLVDEHISGLKNALNSERTERKKLADQLKQIGGQLEQGSEAQKQITEISGQLEVSNRRADFFEEASATGIVGKAIKLAWAAVLNDGLIEEFLNHRTNKVDWAGMFDRMKTDYPTLFQTPAPPRVPPGHAGSGAGQPAPAPVDMNQLIRRAAGQG